MVTTDSSHSRKVYPNLAGRMVLTGMDQLWIADITYIRLRDEFVYVAVILDAYSRRVIGWALDRTMEDELTLRALRMTLSQRVTIECPASRTQDRSPKSSHAGALSNELARHFICPVCGGVRAPGGFGD